MEAVGIQLLQGVSGAVYVLTITVVAIRLLVLAKRNRGLPELLLGLSLLAGGSLGASLEAGAMAVREGVEPGVAGAMLAAGKAFGLIALLCQGLFIWKVFRPNAAWSPALVAVCFALSAISFAGFGLHGAFTSGEIPMAWFWPELIARTAGSVWLVTEAVRYHLLMRRRVRLGLADPVVCNRFLLWATGGVFGVAMMLTAVPPVIAPGSTHPLMAFDIVAFSAAGIGFCIAYSLVFFPPGAYLRWVGARARERRAFA